MNNEKTYTATSVNWYPRSHEKDKGADYKRPKIN